MLLAQLFSLHVASFANSLRSSASDATRATNKLYALQKSYNCPIVIHTDLIIIKSNATRANFIFRDTLTGNSPDKKHKKRDTMSR